MIGAACETFPLVATFLVLAEATFLALECIAMHCTGPTERLAAFLALAEALLLDVVSNVFSMRSAFFFLRRLSDLAAEVHDASTSFDIANCLLEILHGRAREAHAVEARCKTATNKNAI